MENNNENKGFQYTYSAKEQEEIKKIREKYLPPETDKMEQLRRLDAGVTRKGTTVSLVIGIIGALVLGTGMSMCMVWTELFAVGIAVGVVGIIMVAPAYPLYSRITRKERDKIASEVLRLTDELLK